MGFMQEFKEFAIKGNMVDLAVGLIIGSEFGKIINSLVNDMIMPPIGLLLGNVDFKNIFVLLRGGNPAGPYMTLADAQKSGAITLNVGQFVTTFVSFLIIAFSVFLVVRVVNRLRNAHLLQRVEPK